MDDKTLDPLDALADLIEQYLHHDCMKQTMSYQRRRQDDFARSSDSSSLGNPGQYDPADLNLDTMDPYHAVRMNNPDPGNAFMYQIPLPASGVGGTMRKPSSETQIE